MKAELDEVHGTSESSFKTVYNWVNELKCGRTSTHEEPRLGRPVEAVMPKIIEKIPDMILNDRRVKVQEIVEVIGTSHGTVITILPEKLSMKKPSERWVPFDGWFSAFPSQS